MLEIKQKYLDIALGLSFLIITIYHVVPIKHRIMYKLVFVLEKKS